MVRQAKTKQRRFNVEFFPILELKTNPHQLISIPVSLKHFFDKLSNVDIKKRLLLVNGERIRLQEVKKLDRKELSEYNNLSSSNNIWKIVFIKFKDSEVFGLADENGSYDEEAFESLLNSEECENKYLASATPCIYDADKNIMIIPRNKEGVSSSSILECIRKICKKRDLDFGYISAMSNIDFTTDILFKNLDVSFGELTTMASSTEGMLNREASTVFEAISCGKKMGCDTMSVSMTMGDKKNESLIIEAGKDMLALSRCQCDNINILRLGVITPGNNKIQRLDLLKDKLSDSFTISYDSKKRIKSEDILNKLLKSYDSKYPQVN